MPTQVQVPETNTGLEHLCYQCLVSEKIHCGMTVQNYDIPEVQLIVEIWRLIEELGNVWLEFLVQLCELESLVCNMKVRISSSSLSSESL